ncbi:hypothetical protein [Paenibacillus pinihumi]|uniref:hypothetical protein n=1 Tax=Paenibacillus pinihumi TaxID=669462 RepID=UPI000426838F|nr:hypothetical protein [Paenibacillus pinihumi]
MSITIKAHFNKQVRDSKKELVQFYVKGEDENSQALNNLVREIVEVSVNGLDSLTAHFIKKSQDAKKTVLDFVINGGASNKHSYEFYKLAGTDIELSIELSDVEPEEFEERQEKYREGLKGKINQDGTVDVDENQMTLDEVDGDPMAGVEEELPFEDDGSEGEGIHEDELPF